VVGRAVHFGPPRAQHEIDPEFPQITPQERRCSATRIQLQLHRIDAGVDCLQG
jgi:hypothetical protein